MSNLDFPRKRKGKKKGRSTIDFFKHVIHCFQIVVIQEVNGWVFQIFLKRNYQEQIE